MVRVEDKYRISPTDIWSLKSRLSEAMEFDSAGNEGEYLISSVYFDDLWDTCLNDTASGNPVRKKYRIRIYNNDFSVIKLEIKNKIYSRIHKTGTLISQDEMRKLLNGETIRNPEDTNAVVAEFNRRILEGGLRPRVIVTYERKAFVSEAGNVRITIDTDIRGSTETDHFGDRDLIYDNTDVHSVLEIKYDEFIPDYILQLLETGGMVQSSCSKYRLCRELFR